MSALTLTDQQNLSYPDKLKLARRVRKGWWNRQDIPEDDRIDGLNAACAKLMPNDSLGAARLFSEALLP